MEDGLATGVNTIITYDNIAIVILMVVVLMESAWIYMLKEDNKNLIDKIFDLKDVLNKLKEVIMILNERISHHGEN